MCTSIGFESANAIDKGDIRIVETALSEMLEFELMCDTSKKGCVREKT